VSFIDGDSRHQISLPPACIDDDVAPDSLVRVVDAFVASLDLAELGFNRAVAAATGRPGVQPGDMLRLYIWGYLNQVRSSRHLERWHRCSITVFGQSLQMRSLRPLPRRAPRNSASVTARRTIDQSLRERIPSQVMWVDSP
jgi:hypothetical protein